MPTTPNQQLHIAICDDESIDCQQAADLTREIMAAEGLACDLSRYESATALLTAIQGGAQFHILLLDVMMEGLDGMELAAALRELGDATAIIFMSTITSAGKDRKAKGGGRNWKQQRDDAVICA